MPNVKEAEQAMKAAVEAMRREFSSVRTGKATPALLDTVRVEAYGTQMPLNQVASLSTPDPTLIVVQPFDQSLVGAIEKGILTADLGLNPSNDGNLIRVPVPPLNEERRKEYVKLLHKMAEEGRISIRHARHKARDTIQSLIKEHEVGEDDGHRQIEEVESLTHQYTESIEDLLKKKEEEVMSI
ncbi:MAG: ribosome recycling factor [Longimicrobiales bacterium]